ncbi:MAG: 2-amino-4-hydroxy-6-hydroxymethyldihydropteridine diphosphokinase [Acidimicrobiia bacterium]|nr:2-amino-4-hydroxy-6-hydroxymethyldihydropteridine diphosphokinase [Acidimicrobiia bacterium]
MGGVALARVAVAIGSNLGDRERHVREAGTRLAALLDACRLSPAIETDAVGVGRQPRFLNAAAVGHTTLAPRALLERLLAIEADLGRTRPAPGAARTLDLDLIFYDQQVIDEPGLAVPHPRFRDREFVLAPLAAVAADWRDPVTALSVQTLLDRLRRTR